MTMACFNGGTNIGPDKGSILGKRTLFKSVRAIFDLNETILMLYEPILPLIGTYLLMKKIKCSRIKCKTIYIFHSNLL